jgi:hypothetical protein
MCPLPMTNVLKLLIKETPVWNSRNDTMTGTERNLAGSEKVKLPSEIIDQQCLHIQDWLMCLRHCYDFISELIKIHANLNIEKPRIFCMFIRNDISISDRLK